MSLVPVSLLVILILLPSAENAVPQLRQPWYINIRECSRQLALKTKLLNAEEIDRFCEMKVGWHSRAETARQQMQKLASSYNDTSKELETMAEPPLKLALQNLFNHLGTCSAWECFNRNDLFVITSGAQNSTWPPAIRRDFSKAKRKEYRLLSDDERNRLHDAINKLKKHLFLQNTSVSVYDAFARCHSAVESPAAHGGPAFAPFHRELLNQFELALRIVDPSLAIPYWDSTLDHSLPNPSDSILWHAVFLGNADGYVTTGPFAHWPTAPLPLDREEPPRKVANFLHRQIVDWPPPYNSDGSRFWFPPPNVSEHIISTTASFAELSACNNDFEPLHGRSHVFVGGHMNHIELSPHDPVFYFTHAFFDFLWEEFRQRMQNRDQREATYPSEEKACCRTSPEYPCPEYYYANAMMKPFPIRNIDGLRNHYTDEFYEYEPTPRCSAGNRNCKSKYLFCQNRFNHLFRCASKIRLGGDCKGLEDQENSPCFEGTCVSGTCVGGGI